MDSNDAPERYISRASLTLSGVVAFLALFVISFVTYLAFAHGFTLFAWHPPFMLIGFLAFMTHAVLAFSNDTLLTAWVDRTNRVKLHWILQICAATCILIAFVCIYTYKISKDKEHFTSTHGSWGLWTLILCIGTVCGGIVASYAVSLRHVIRPVFLKIAHSSAGIITYSAAVLTIFYGLDHPWMQERLSFVWINVLVAMVAMIWLYAVSKPVLTLCARIGGLAYSE